MGWAQNTLSANTARTAQIVACGLFSVLRAPPSPLSRPHLPHLLLILHWLPKSAKIRAASRLTATVTVHPRCYKPLAIVVFACIAEFVRLRPVHVSVTQPHVFNTILSQMVALGPISSGVTLAPTVSTAPHESLVPPCTCPRYHHPESISTIARLLHHHLRVHRPSVTTPASTTHRTVTVTMVSSPSIQPRSKSV